MFASPPADRTRSDRSALLAATFVAGAMIAQQVASKAARDALFLGNFPVSQLPDMVLAAAALSLILLVPTTRLLARIGPARFVPAAFLTSGILLLLEWVLFRFTARVGTIAIYLHVAALGPALVSGFWSLISERFDPRTARRRMGRIVTGATLGGLLGGLVAERVGSLFGAANVLPVLAALHVLCGAGILRVRDSGPFQASADKPDSRSARAAGDPDESGGDETARREAASTLESAHLTSEGMGLEESAVGSTVRAGLRSLWRNEYLRSMALLVLLGTVAAGLLDFAFKMYTYETFAGRQDQLVRFFAFFYAATGFATFVIQTTVSRGLLERWGPSRTTGVLPATVAAGSLAGLFLPGLPVAAIARGSEAVLRSSLFRSGYEVLYAPIDPLEKRRSKAWIDVGCDRLGDGLGAILVKGLLLLPSQLPAVGLFGLALIASLASLRIGSRLARGYVMILQKSMLQRAEKLDLTKSSDHLSRSMVLQTFSALDRRALLAQIEQARSDSGAAPTSGAAAESGPTSTSGAAEKSKTTPRRSSHPSGAAHFAHPPGSPGPRRSGSIAESEAAVFPEDTISQQVRLLRSGNLAAIRGILGQVRHDPVLAAHMIPLLAWDDACEEAIRALRLLAPRCTGLLRDALLDPGQEFAVRRRIPRILVVLDSSNAVNGLQEALRDKRFEVRFQCGRALAIIRRRHPQTLIDRPSVMDAVLQELKVERPIWESRRLLDQDLEDSEDPQASAVDRLLRDRSSRSLEHVFTLLSLIISAQPLKVAYRGLHTDDPVLRGTALEYLESVLPAPVRERLWPFLESGPSPTSAPRRTRREVLDQLMRSHDSIAIQLGELAPRQRMDEESPES